MCDRIHGYRNGVKVGEAPFANPNNILGEIVLPVPSAGLKVLISEGKIGHFYQET